MIHGTCKRLGISIAGEDDQGVGREYCNDMTLPRDNGELFEHIY